MNLRTRQLPITIIDNRLSEEKQHLNPIEETLIVDRNNFLQISNNISEQDINNLENFGLEMNQGHGEGMNFDEDQKNVNNHRDEVPGAPAMNQNSNNQNLQLVANVFASTFAAANPIGKMPVFFGDSTDILPEIFIKKWNSYAKVNSLSDEKKLNLAGMSLKGLAETWFNDLDEDANEKNDWIEFSNSLIKRFTVPNSDANNFKLFTSRKQKPKESVEQYADELKKIVQRIRNKAMIPEIVQATTFTSNLLPHFTRIIESQPTVPQTFMEAVLFARRLESSASNYQEKISSYNYNSNSSSSSNNGNSNYRGNNYNPNYSQRNTGKQQNQPFGYFQPSNNVATNSNSVDSSSSQQVGKPFNNSFNERPQRDMSKVVCNRCKQNGHFAGTCPTLKEVTCFKCQQQGHFANRCPNEKAVIKEEKKDMVRVVTESESEKKSIKVDNNTAVSNNSFTTIVHVGDIRTHAIVDSGASRHCMSSSFYNRFDKKQYLLKPCDISMYNANGAALKVLGCVQMDIEFNESRYKTSNDKLCWTFHVIENLVDNVLIGSGDIDRVTLNNGLIIRKQVNLVHVTEAVTIPGHTAKLIQIKSDKIVNDHQYFEPSSFRCGHIARCIVQQGSQSHITNIMNTGTNPIHLSVNQIIGDIQDGEIVIDADRNVVCTGREDEEGDFPLFEDLLDGGCVTDEFLDEYLLDEIALHDGQDVKIDIIPKEMERETIRTVHYQTPYHFNNSTSEKLLMNPGENVITDDDILNQIDTRLTSLQRNDMFELLKLNRHIFSSNPKGPGMVTHVEHSIDTGNAAPIKQRAYRTSKAEEQHIKKELDEMMENGIIRESSSPWSSPVVLVTKKDNSLRFCIDYRKVNNITTKDSYPLPKIQDTLDALYGAKYFSSLDFASGYWQIKVRDEDIPKTAFVTKQGLFEFIRMPFGLCNAPGTFQRAMDVLLTGLNWKIALIYIDDILIYSSTYEKHLKDVQLVIDRLSDAKFTVKLSKCFFGREEVNYLGHLVTSKGILPDPSKVIAIKQFPIPQTLTQVRSFLGLTTYYHRFVPCYSTIAEPLYRLQKKNIHFSWSNECQQAFDSIKQLLISSPTLRYPNFDREFLLMTDASNVGVGAILSQIDIDEKEYVIGYASRALSNEERNYSTTERECLAVLFGIKFFRPYLHGTHFTIITDHGSLTWLMNLRDCNGRLARWSLQLQGLHYSIKHRPGREHANVDALSRSPIAGQINNKLNSTIQVPLLGVTTRSKRRLQEIQSNSNIQVEKESKTESKTDSNQMQVEQKEKQNLETTSIDLNINNVESKDNVIDVQMNSSFSSSESDSKQQLQFESISISTPHVVSEPSLTLFRSAQLEEPEFAAVINYLKFKQLPSNSDAQQSSRIRMWSSNFTINNDLLYRIWTPTNLNQRLDIRKVLVVPSKLRQEIMIHNHDSYVGGHLGVLKTFTKIRDRFWWSTMYQDVELYCRSCLICQRRKIPRRQRETALLGTPIADYPFLRVGVDVVGPLPQTLSGNKYIVVFTDSFTRWPEAFPVPEQKEETIAQLLVEELICRYGAPKYLVSDRGSNFLSCLSMKVYELLKINKITTTSYHPQSNGITERFNGVLIEMLSMFSNESDWDAYIPYVLSAYRSSYNNTTQETPYYLTFGRQMTLPIDTMLNVGEAYYTDQSDYADEMAYRLNESNKRVKVLLKKIISEREEKNNEIQNIKQFSVGDKVWLRSVTPVNVNTKLNENHFKGPFTILERTSEVNYKLDVPLSSHGKTIHNIVHVDRLKQYYNPDTTSAAAAAGRT